MKHVDGTGGVVLSLLPLILDEYEEEAVMSAIDVLQSYSLVRKEGMMIVMHSDMRQMWANSKTLSRYCDVANNVVLAQDVCMYLHLYPSQVGVDESVSMDYAAVCGGVLKVNQMPL
eukprot:GFYU01012052.1.p3 GENE.GFYU01012052.1~~GFYU01012052.1.p3  ORF type:complete len:116 (-),score=32.99 GFYU01012052.1:158-505(-)